jgi:hypothetical protein
MTNIQIFYVSTLDAAHNKRIDGHAQEAGYYWAFGEPGCLPDTDPQGPFESGLSAYTAGLKELNEMEEA